MQKTCGWYSKMSRRSIRPEFSELQSRLSHLHSADGLFQTCMLEAPMESGRRLPTGWLDWRRFYSLSRAQANKVFVAMTDPASRLPPLRCDLDCPRLRVRHLLPDENLRMVRDFIRCPYNRNNGTSAADNIIQAVRQNDTRQIIARQIIVRQIRSGR